MRNNRLTNSIGFALTFSHGFNAAYFCYILYTVDQQLRCGGSYTILVSLLSICEHAAFRKKM